MHQDIAAADLDVSPITHAGDVGLRRPELAGRDGSDEEALFGGGLDLAALRLHLNLALGGDQLQGLFEPGFGAGHIQADGFADVVQPASSRALVGVALGDLVEVAAGG